MRHPSEFYVRYLMAESWGDDEDPLDLESTNLTLEQYGLPRVNESQFEYLRTTFEAPDTFRFNNRNHAASVAFMKEEKLFSLWKATEDMTRVLKEMVGVNIQHTTHLLLMGDVPSKVIADKVSRKFRLQKSITEGMVDHYRHYFWRVQSLTEREWEEFLAGDRYYDQFMASLYGGDQQALFRAGFNPKYDYKQGLRDTHRQIVFRIQYLGFQADDKRIIDQLIKMSREQRSLYTLLYGEGGGFEEQVKEIRRFLMEHREPAVKILEELIAEGDGSYSGDGSEETKVGAPTKKKAIGVRADKKVTRAKPKVKAKIKTKKGDQ